MEYYTRKEKREKKTKAKEREAGRQADGDEESI